MLLILRNGIPENDIQTVMERIHWMGMRSFRSTYEGQSALGVVMEDRQLVDSEAFKLFPQVERVLAISTPYKLASRAFHPENTRVVVGDVTVGGEALAIMAGPCAVENEAQIHTIARLLKDAGVRVLRGGAYKPRTSPYSFQGLGADGLKLIREAADENGMAVVSEIISPDDLDQFSRYVDLLQVGARNMQNFNLLKALGSCGKPVLLKRSPSATYTEWLMAAEYIISAGNDRIILCERGIRSFETYTRNTLDLTAVPVMKALSHFPVMVDPSHGTGLRDKVVPMALAAVAAGADGILVEVHPQPDMAISDGFQSLTPKQFTDLMPSLARVAIAIGRQPG